MPDYQTIRGISTFEYEEKRLLRVQRAIMYSYSTVLGERITALKETIRKYYEN